MAIHPHRTGDRERRAARSPPVTGSHVHTIFSGGASCRGIK